jgi:hypothetical protein
MKVKAKREGSLKVDRPFDEAMARALRVKPPLEGWKEYERGLKSAQPRKVRKTVRRRTDPE